MIFRILSLLSILSILYSCSPKLPEEVNIAMELLPNELDYNQHVKPILSDKCFACHGPDKNKQKAGLRLDLASTAYLELPENPGKYAIDPGSLRNSEVIRRIISNDPDVVMPTPESHLNLTSYEKAILIRWIDEGAEYKPHWAFVATEMPGIPKVDQPELVKSPIDNFILSKLKEKGLKPSKQADKEILVRRVTIDLTGLPPTLLEIDQFLNDKSPDAYEKLVDRLLKSPHYGERLATDWLDVARFADSHGYTVDRIRDMSPYRDWVIESFNKNQRYDQFLHWQIAGDLMKGPKGGAPSKEMLIATAFNRNHPQNLEGGIVEEEFKTEYVLDRANTIGDGVLALSVGCARCHDHKYDPVSQKNYFELSAFFVNIQEAGQISWDNAMPAPVLQLPTKSEEKELKLVNDEILALIENLETVQKIGEKDFQKWINNKDYQSLAKIEIPKVGLQAVFNFDKKDLKNTVNKKETAFLTRETGKEEEVEFVEGKHREGVKFNGDTWMKMGNAGIFRKSEPFSIGLWVNIPPELTDGVIMHKSLAERLYNFRGYHLFIKNGKLEMNLGHVYPGNAITKLAKKKLPTNQWIQLTMTYDGSSKAAGLNLYLNGKSLEMDTKMDQLSKDIIFDIKQVSPQPGIQLGGWWRGNGFTNGKIDDLMVYDRELTLFEIGILAETNKWQTIASKSSKTLSKQDELALRNYYFSCVHLPSLKMSKEITNQRSKLADLTEPIQELMVFKESPQPKQSYVLDRGLYDAIGEKVYPNTPEAIFKFPKSFPKNRVGLAQWITDARNPLTSRVAVNRYWQMFFGVGIVKTAEDFGNQGELPTHPKLLDYLAIEFQKSGWNVKHLVKSIVMSGTYRQDSKLNKEYLEKDAPNRYLARGPAIRLTAEMMRDNALTASGLLNEEIGGKSIKPYQPEGLWRINGATYVPDTGATVYKRSLYVIIKRSVPNPTLATFDAPARNTCTVRRQKTNTPLQALVTLNDPTFVEASMVIGEKMTLEPNFDKSLSDAFRSLTGRKPIPEEIKILKALKEKELARFSANLDKTKGWTSAGQYQVDNQLNKAEVAANAVVASTIMNSDATLIKR